MNLLIHGDNIGQSRVFYNEEKQKYKEIKVLNGDKLSMTELVEAVEGDGLFLTNDAIFIEQFFAKNKIGSDFEAILAYLNKKHAVPVFFWEGKEIDKKQLLKLNAFQIKLFSFPKTLFQFLDALQPSNGKQLVTLFHKTLQTEAAELILFMLTKQVRILLAVQTKSDETIDEVKRMQPWQVGKLQKQTKLFTFNHLKYIHSKLYDFDLGYKTGVLPSPLETSLDFFLAEI